MEKIDNVGLGNTLGALREKYGKFEYISGSIFFKDENINVNTPISFTDDDLVSNLSISFESTENPFRTLEEVLELANTLIPQDAVKIDQKDFIVDENYTETIIEYKSDLLAKSINNQELYPNAEIGNFVLLTTKYTGDEFDVGYFHLQIITGNPYREKFRGYNFFK